MHKFGARVFFCRPSCLDIKSLQAAREIIAGFLRRRLAGEVLGLTVYYDTTATVYATRILSLGVTDIMRKRNKDAMLRLFLDGLGGE